MYWRVGKEQEITNCTVSVGRSREMWNKLNCTVVGEGRLGRVYCTVAGWSVLSYV